MKLITLRTANLTNLGFIILMSLFLIQCSSGGESGGSDDRDDTEDETDTDNKKSDSEDEKESDKSSDKEDSDEKDDDTESEDEEDSESEDMSLVLMIDDFEDGDSIPLLGGFWYSYDDNENDGASSITTSTNDDGEIVMDGEGYESDAAFSMSFAFDKGDYEWDPYVGWGMGFGDGKLEFDASGYGGVSYMFKGSDHFFIVETSDVADYDYYKIAVKGSEKWKKVDVPFVHLVQEGWGEPVALELANVTAISFQAKGTTGDEGTFDLDDIGFLGTEAVKPEKDLEILDADVPDKNELEDLTISNPLQQLAMDTLNHGANITNWLEQGKFESYEYDEDYVNALAANGFKALRLPIDLDRYIVDRDAYFEGDAEFEVEAELFEILDNFEAWTAAAGMSLTIDFHQYDESLDIDDSQYVDAAVALWTAVAEHFALNTREDLFYELMNEPELSAGVSAVDQDDYTVFAQQLIDGIRSVDTTHAILFGDVEWNALEPLTMREPFEDDKIIYVFHFYKPFEFTHQGASWSGLGTTHDMPWPYSPERWSEYSIDFGYMPNMDSWHFMDLKKYYKQANKNWLYNNIASAKSWAIENNVPVICNEFGVYDAKVQDDDKVNYYTDLIDVFEELEIPWQVWFMMVDADTGEMDADLQTALQLEAPSDEE